MACPFSYRTTLTCLSAFLSVAPVVVARPNLATQAFKTLLEARYHYLSERSCVNPCGWSQQLCCAADQTCGVNAAGQAVCNAGIGSGQPGWQVYTTTFVETDLATRTSTYSSYWAQDTTQAAPAAVNAANSCDLSKSESPCGGICCSSGQYCAYAGQCVTSQNDDGASSSLVLGQIYTPSAPAPSQPPETVTNIAPVRPTSVATAIITSTGKATITVPYKTSSANTMMATTGAISMTSTTSNNGLSGGAIAGIVIGVLFAIVLLIFLLLCCCCKAGLDGVMAFFGLGRKRRQEKTTIIEERHRHGTAVAPSRRWFGSRPARIDQPAQKKSGVGGLTAVAGFLGALGCLLGLRKKQVRREKSDHSSSTSSYYSDYYSTDSSESSRSDDRYTRRSGRTAGTSRR